MRTIKTLRRHILVGFFVKNERNTLLHRIHIFTFDSCMWTKYYYTLWYGRRLRGKFYTHFIMSIAHTKATENSMTSDHLKTCFQRLWRLLRSCKKQTRALRGYDIFSNEWHCVLYIFVIQNDFHKRFSD